jgi:transcription-repair coupling factor (superfamily II helicase)
MDYLNRNGIIYVMGRIGSFISFLLSGVRRKTIVFYESEDEALLLGEELQFFAGREIDLFPVYANRVFEQEDEVKRIRFLFRLIHDETFVGLFPYSALTRPLIPPSTIREQTRTVRFGDTVFQEELIEYLDGSGYEQASLVRDEGTYAKRGSIIDVFPPSSEKPIRMEFLGDEVYSLRFFDPQTQRSTKEIETCSLTPVKRPGEGTSTILDYITENMVLVHKGFRELRTQEGMGKDYDEKLRKKTGAVLNIDISGIKGEEEGLLLEALSNEDLHHLFELRKTEIFKTLSEKLTGEWREHRYIYLFANSSHHAERLREIFSSYGIGLPILSSPAFGRRPEKEWGIVVGPLRRGFRTADVVVLTEEDIVGPKKRVVRRTSDGLDEFLSSFRDLSVGEWVVHVDHGIGIYKGITELQIDGFTKDFLLIEYQDGDRLYVPVEDLHLVQKFIGSEKFRPKIDRLGSQAWKNVKKRVRRQVEDIAQDLLDIYAERSIAQGHAYPEEDELFTEMGSRFPYEETEDQLKAIEEVLGDLKSIKPMDRLVCGDVGFGKTEVALRAAFKAALDNKQVALLVPTTVLAQQHYKSFQERLQDYPANVEVLSRFKSKEEQKRIVEAVKKGTVDILIGTHRLLQKDLEFRDLGLLIIDEEHRFGVKHKEKLKEMRKNIDVLALSATPIPRTLYMSTMGIRDLSIINTPPLDRLAVKTHVVRFDDSLITQAVRNELRRGGQIFFVHNYIHNIGVVHDHLQRLVPEARIAVAHGRMEGPKLEKVMLDFIDRQYDILLSTNIIESGLDISNVNTIFINNAHRMGLADLYQLRGRVGRSTKQAYAYLLVPKDDDLTRDASLRLKIIEELTALGSGFHIASYDLEIRGAGSLLGREQSGNINLIGFELYCNMLGDAVKALKERKEVTHEEVTTEIKIPIDAFIPDPYINDATQKLLTYKRLSKIRDEAELREMEEELTDRYGPIPKPLESLIAVLSLKCLASRACIRKLEYSARQLVIHVTPQTPLKMEKILGMAKDPRKKIKLLPDGRVIFGTDEKGTELLGLARNLLLEIVTI